MVVGSGIMSALGLRQSHDVDLIVSSEVFEKLKADGWQTGHIVDRPVIYKDNFDVGMYWAGQQLDYWLPKATWIGGVPYLPIEDVLEWKQQVGREKDAADIALIKSYL
ncbi:MAG: hypothetical protein JWM37_657 [Candidatus Saccharibacteria bacterium]|nr:hypothetical protein [Candidatus Saccharibacteria bacterium]